MRNVLKFIGSVMQYKHVPGDTKLNTKHIFNPTLLHRQVYTSSQSPWQAQGDKDSHTDMELINTGLLSRSYVRFFISKFQSPKRLNVESDKGIRILLRQLFKISFLHYSQHLYFCLLLLPLYPNPFLLMKLHV